MKYCWFTVLVLACMCVGCSTSDSRLYGTWKSDREATIDYNRNHTKISDRELQALGQMFGHLIVVYQSGGRSSTTMEAHTITRGTETESFDSLSDKSAYRIVAKDDDSVVIELGEDKTILTIHFEGDNMYWIYLGDKDLSGRHMREYFRRIK